VDALGIDASKARDEARATRSEVAPFTKDTTDARARVLEAHKEILMWEGRSAFEEPYRGLEEAYAGAAKAVGVWLEARKVEKKSIERAETCDRGVADLEFQIHELRAALAKLEQNVEEEKTKREERIAALDAKTEGLQIDLLALATRFCAPLRRRPEPAPVPGARSRRGGGASRTFCWSTMRVLIAPNSFREPRCFRRCEAIADGSLAACVRRKPFSYRSPTARVSRPRFWCGARSRMVKHPRSTRSAESDGRVGHAR
jgi:hypothetical protein